MKLITIFEEIELNELQGISFDARAWAPVISNAIKLSKNTKEPVIDGKGYPKEYKLFPIDFIHFQVNPRYGRGAAYDENRSGYDKNNQYHVYFVFGDLTEDSSINHELRHAFEDYMRLSKGHQGLKQTKEATNYFSGDFEKFMMAEREKEYFMPISTLIEGLYYTSKIERSAFSDTVYDEPRRAEIITYITVLIKASDASHILYKISPEILEKKWKQYKENFHIPITDKFNNYEDFIKWACDEIQYKGNKTLKKLRNVQYHSQQSKKEGGK